MNIKRAVVAGIIAWVLIFFEVSVLMFGLGLQTGNTYYVAHYILSAIIIVFASLYYFATKKSKKGFVEGLLAGLVLFLTGIVLDALITVPLFVKDYNFFLNPYMFI